MEIKFANAICAKFLKREKRFFVYVEQNDNFVLKDGLSVAYCSNNGRMQDLLIPGAKCLFEEYSGELRWKWQAVFLNGIWIGVNPHNPQLLCRDLLKKLWPNEEFQHEVTFGHYRADFASKAKVVEVKNAHWDVNGRAFFPDCITTRGGRQMLDLVELQKTHECFVIYILQRSDLNQLGIADWIDKIYGHNSLIAQHAGVKCLAFNCLVDEKGIKIHK